ncbi:MAG: hypothetical protein GY724_01090 [Actinomycetia bacterium]|nr:hypothetical protein [Actinomycetes bacterium]
MGVIRFSIRLLSRLGLRWLIIGGAARMVARRLGRSTVQRATEELEAKAENLPAPVARAVRALPAEARQVGGSAVVAGRAARSALGTTRRASQLARTTSKRAASSAGAARVAVDSVKAETEASGRRLRARYLAATVGPNAATDSLLDVRTSPFESDSPSRDLDLDSQSPQSQYEPHDRVPGPVGRGRLRSRRRAAPVVGRMGRTYRPSPKPWD